MRCYSAFLQDLCRGDQPHGDAIGHLIRVITDPLPTPPADEHDARVHVAITPGLTGRSGPLGLEQRYERSVPVASGLAATRASVRYPGDGLPIIAVEFNNPIDRNAIERLVSVDPKVPYTVSSSYGNNELLLQGDFQPATRYAIRIAKAPAGTPRQNLPEPRRSAFSSPIGGPSLSFEHREGYLGSAGNRTVLAHAVNVTNLRATVTRIYDNNLVVWRNTHAEHASAWISRSRPRT